MSEPTIHFTPVRGGTAHGRFTPPPTISVTALAGVPGLVRQTFGERLLQHANRAARLDIELIEDQDCFIPHATMTAFLSEIERRSGEALLGLLLAPHLSVATYGCWGRYILEAGTLGIAIGRAVRAMVFHSRGDQAGIAARDGIASFTYLSAARGREGYAHVACGAVGVMINLCRSYLSPHWRPLRVDLDIARRDAARFEDVFGCPVVLDAPVLSVHFPAELLDAPRTVRSRAGILTIGEVARLRSGAAQQAGVVGAVAAQVWTQVLAGAVSIDSTAHALDTSVRSLQRALRQEGTDFRSLANAVRLRRAKELLAGSAVPITDIAIDLGYSAPANFARAFRKATGLTPGDFRSHAARGR